MSNSVFIDTSSVGIESAIKEDTARIQQDSFADK